MVYGMQITNQLLGFINQLIDRRRHSATLYPLVNVYSSLLNMDIKIVDLPMKYGDFQYLFKVMITSDWNFFIAFLNGWLYRALVDMPLPTA